MSTLETHGNRIAVLELEGSLFFGSADHLTREIDRHLDTGVQYVILDMKRVTGTDLTTARLLSQTASRLKQQGRILAVSYLERDGVLGLVSQEGGLLEALGEDGLFPDTDHALEHFEERILAEFGGEAAQAGDVPLEAMPILRGLSPEDVDTVRGLMQLGEFAQGDVLFQEGDTDRDLFLITDGAADVTIGVGTSDRRKRLTTFAPGTVIGEMALLEGEPRSATVAAREPLRCWRLGRAAFEQLEREHPHIGLVLLRNLARLLSERVRSANDVIRELEA